jgi:NtrC-family two-component system sensor histidine kinase KinB
MSLRTKLTIGLAFLFMIIFALAIYSSLNIQRLSKDAESIIKDNYDSLVYCKNMLLALEDMRTTVSSKVMAGSAAQMSYYDSRLFETSRATFELNLRKEQGNITEVHEAGYVNELNNDYRLFLNLGMQINREGGSPALYLKNFIPAYMNTRQTIVKINDLNMEAVERKNTSAGNDSKKMIISMAAVGSACIILAFFYFWYFPFFVSNSLSYLAGKMKELLKSMGIKIDTQTKDEAFILLNSINLLESKLIKKKKRRVG